MRKLPMFIAALALIPAIAQAEIHPIFFPTDPTLTFTDDYGDPRSGHAHEGVDILGPKMTPLYAANDSRVDFLPNPEPSYGWMISLKDSNDGWIYNYIHVNNDNPGTDDDMGGTSHAYAPGITENSHVTKGQLVGWMGDSGNAENIASHLHFEIRHPDGTSIDPYESLIAAKSAATGIPPGPGSGISSTYSVSAALAASPTINDDKRLIPSSAPTCTSGSLIKTSASKAVYYCGTDGKRYVFPNDRAYFTWYPNYNNVETISTTAMGNITLGGNVTYRPGVKMIKIQSDPKTYVIERGGVLRWVSSESVAVSLYGANWKTKVDDISDAFFVNYTMGNPVN